MERVLGHTTVDPLCEIFLVPGGLSYDPSRPSNYQVLHKLSVRPGLFTDYMLVVMKSLSRQTNIISDHIII